jgi:hypothetical protein
LPAAFRDIGLIKTKICAKKPRTMICGKTRGNKKFDWCRHTKRASASFHATAGMMAAQGFALLISFVNFVRTTGYL